MKEALQVRVPGPLAGHVPELVDHLAKRGYADSSMTYRVRCLAHMSRWLDGRGLDPSAIDESLIEQVVGALHQAGKERKLMPCSFRVVLRFLRDRGIVPAAPAVPATPIGELVEDYRRYLVVERGLAPLTVLSYINAASWFLAEACKDDPGRVADLTAALLARMLGVHISVAVAWQRASSGDWTAYAADVSRRGRHHTTPTTTLTPDPAGTLP